MLEQELVETMQFFKDTLQEYPMKATIVPAIIIAGISYIFFCALTLIF